MVRTVAEVLAAPEIQERGMIAEVADDRHGTLKMLASPLKMSATPPRIPSAPPRLGEHTDHILIEVLATDPNIIAKLRHDRVIK